MLSQMADTFCEMENPLPQISAGEDFRVKLPTPAELVGSCSNCSSNLQARWELVAGPGAVSLGSRALHSQAQFSEPGSYTLRLTVSDGLFRTSDEVLVVASGSN